jgi:hypothetical protein
VLSPGKPLGDAPVPIEPGVEVLGVPGWFMTGGLTDMLDPVVEGSVDPPARVELFTPGTPPAPGLALIPAAPPPVAPPVPEDCANTKPAGAISPLARTMIETIRRFIGISFRVMPDNASPYPSFPATDHRLARR